MDARRQHDAWFYWLGRIETASLVVPLAIAMPLKNLVDRPAAVGWTGWLHGLLLIIYLVALMSVARAYALRLEQDERDALRLGDLANVLGEEFVRRVTGNREDSSSRQADRSAGAHPQTLGSDRDARRSRVWTQ